MTATGVLTIVLLAAATAACVAVIWGVRELVATARSTRLLADDMRERLVPLLDKADVTVDAANAELLRIDGVLTQLEDATARVSNASNTISEIVQAPGEIVSGVAGRVRQAWKDRKHAQAVRSEEQAAETPEPQESAETPVDEPVVDGQ